ncbi:hypothetical protein BaLi_c00290 [Bacillus paralicheniformis ATCC 9945a]|nr:hypothetical protein BaLi_c00290 [Bacillus paralicheniformis ATCC 9945a]
MPCTRNPLERGRIPFSRFVYFKVCLKQVVLTLGSCAMGIHEPCQVRKEAALSGTFHVPQGCLG